MLGFSKINKVAVVVTAICTLLLSSCEATVQPSSAPVVSVKNPKLDYAKGQVFVSVKCSSSWTLSLKAEDGTPVDWATVSPSSGSGDKNNVILSYQRNTSEESRKLNIILESGKTTSMCSVVQAGPGDRPVEDPEVDPETGGTSVKTSWMELPSMDNQDLSYYSHHFKMNGKTYRNYTFGWSQKDLVALWVAYPLCSMYTNKSVDRTNAWAYDPLLGEDKSAAPFSHYGGDYARGHQLPSADRLCCYEANAQTFYGTNMTPQLNAHNEGIWSNLEGYVRNIANNSDTTYVVTGCVVKGSKEITSDSDGKDMTVPVAYYKALLRYSKSSTLSTWAAMAFYTEHKSYSKNTTLASLAMSVDELEQKLGIDFFVNLPAQVGDAKAASIEAEDPTKNQLWGL